MSEENGGKVSKNYVGLGIAVAIALGAASGAVFGVAVGV